MEWGPAERLLKRRVTGSPMVSRPARCANRRVIAVRTAAEARDLGEVVELLWDDDDDHDDQARDPGRHHDVAWKQHAREGNGLGHAENALKGVGHTSARTIAHGRDGDNHKVAVRTCHSPPMHARPCSKHAR